MKNATCGMFAVAMTFAGVVFASTAYGANITVSKVMGKFDGDASPYTASSLEYKASPSNSSAPYRTQTGWYAGLNLAWSTSSSNRQRAADTKAKVEDGGKLNSQDEYTVYYLGDKTPSGCGMKNSFTSGLTKYMSNTEWYIYVTPEFMYSLNGADYSATLTIGGNAYTIIVPHDIILSDGSHQRYPVVGLLGDELYGDAQYLASKIDPTNYNTVKFLVEPVDVTFGPGFAASDNGDRTWGVTMTHSHAWTYSVGGAMLTATCGNAGCPVGGLTTVSLALSSGDKAYDNKAITATVDFGEYFEDIFPDAEATISIIKDEASVETIKDAGTYTVTMTVTGLGDERSYELSKTVTISKVVITDAMLSFTPANPTYNGTEQTVTPSVNANGLAATFEVDTGTSTTSATERGTYSVTVNGTGNFEGTATATWSIVNTTGTGSTVTESATGSMTASGNDFTLFDSSKLEYDAENAVWYAGITIKWPVTTHNGTTGGGYARYVKTDTKKIEYSVGIVQDKTSEGSYKLNALNTTKFTYLDTTTWKVPLSPEIIATALIEEKTELVYTMTAGAFIWGNSTEGDPDGVAFQDYTITIPLDENLKLYDNYGNQVYPAVDYVAQIDGKKYVSLADALAASESGQTVTLIAQDDYDGEYEILEGVTVELGAFGSADATYVLSIDAVLTSDAECTVSTRETGYGVERSGEGPYTYSVVMQHVHNWEVVVNGSVLTATCNAEACPLDVTEYSMRLFTGVKSGATEDVDGKVYDGESMSRKAEFGDGFTDVFPNVETQISVTKGGESVDTINDVGEYVVTMTVTGLGDGQSHELSKTVTISPVDISGSALVLTPATTPYNGTEQTVTPSVTANNLAATIVVDTEGSTTAATEMGTYSVTVNGTGNFEGTATATWSIVNTTGSLSGVTSAVSGIGDYDSENNTLTVTDSTALEYSDGAWYAGITLEWPVNTKDWQALDWSSYAHYVTEDSVKISTESGEITHSASEGSYRSGVSSYPKFDYLASTTWKVAITPAVVEAALTDEKTALEWTMNAGAFESDTYENGVAFADYKIALPLDEPVEFVLGAGEAYDLGDTVLTTTKIQLAAGASVTSSVEQAVANAIYTEETGYDVVRSEDGGKYVYTAKLTHVHDWTYSVDGLTLTATCGAAECPVEGNATTVSLNLSGGDKTYDNTAIAVSAVFDGSFKTVFPDSEAMISTTKDGEPVDNDKIKDAGEYVVTMTVTGLSGGQSRELSRAVTISKVDISEAALVLTPANPTYTGAEQTVTPSVTANNLTATFDVDTENSTTAATEMGTYTVIVNGTGNFAGSTSATWSIVNTTGTPTSVAASAAGSMTNVGNEFTLSDSSKLEYDAEKGEWYAGITITWPMEKKDFEKTSWTYYAHYVTEDSVKATTEQGEIAHAKVGTSYESWNGSYNLLGDMTETKPFTYVATTTWKVPLTPAIIEAAIAEEKASLTYTMNAGSFIWGDDTEGDPDGVAFTDYTITIPLEGITLYDGDGKQVYPKAEGQTIIEDIKDDIGDVVSDAEVAESAKAKIDLLAGAVGEGNEQDVADWVATVKGDATSGEFYAALAQSDYVEASFELGTEKLITGESDVEVVDFEQTEDGFAFAVAIDDGGIEAARVKAASIIQTATSLGDGEFGPLAAERIGISEGNKITVGKDANVDREFFKIVIKKDGGSVE